MRQFTVRDWDWSELIKTGDVGAVAMRPQNIRAAEPYCTKCEALAWPARVSGRWDDARRATAIPFEPVYVVMSCGCGHGDESLTRPVEDHS